PPLPPHSPLFPYTTLFRSLSDSSSFEDQERIAGEIFAHLEDDGKLGSFTLLMHKSWNHFIESTKVNNAHPRLPEHFHALRKLSRDRKSTRLNSSHVKISYA